MQSPLSGPFSGCGAAARREALKTPYLYGKQRECESHLPDHMKNKEVVEFVRNAIKSWNEKELTAEAALFAISSVVNPVEMTRKDIEKVRQIYKKIA